MKYFTSDEHHGHTNMIKYVHRPFKNIDEMTKIIIEKHNSTVTKNDETWHLGDFFWGHSDIRNIIRILTKLNGQHHLVLGNHDEFKPFAYVRAGFITKHTAVEFDDVVYIHDPAASCVRRDKIWLCGHVHDLFVVQKNVINVGVDVHDFFPISEEKIKYIIEEMK